MANEETITTQYATQSEVAAIKEWITSRDFVTQSQVKSLREKITDPVIAERFFTKIALAWILYKATKWLW